MKVKKEIISLTAVRFLAAIMVLLYHYRSVGLFSFSGIFDVMVSNGHLFVSMFFILSGFILAYN